MGWSESQFAVCRNHPFQIPHPGICPCCLRERLSILADGTHNRYTISANYSQPLRNFHTFFSSNSSSAGSPPRRRHHRVASDVIGAISTAFGGLNKSRSVAYAIGEGRSEDYYLKRKKKRGGFWNKLRVFNRG